MLRFEPVAKALGCELPRGVAGKVERKRDFGTEERIAERVQHQGQSAFGDVTLVMADAELGDEPVDRIEDRVQRVTVAAEDHPGGERSRALPPKCVETLVDNHSSIRLPRTGVLDSVGDALRDRIGDRSRKIALEAGRRAEVVEQIGMGPADLGRDRLQGYRLRALLDQ